MNRPILLSTFVIISLSVQAGVPIADPGSRGVDWDAVQVKIDHNDWAARIVRELKQDVHRTQAEYEHPPLGTTGWLHEYYCDDDARRLQFDPEKPHEHVCPHCKRVYSGPPYDDCWRSIVHSSIATATLESAALFRITGERDYLDYAKSTLLWYAKNFDKFDSHGDHAGKGWFREQSLDEAGQLVRLAQAYWDICSSLSESERETIANKFLIPDAKFIHKQTRHIHNINSWHNSAVGLVGFAVGDDELVRAAIDGEFGLNDQIDKGVKEDGFWFEGSISYHFYTIESMQPLVVAARAKHYPMNGMDKYKRMYTAPIQFTFPNGEFPSNNDGWPEHTLTTKGSYYEVACHLWPEKELLTALASIYDNSRRSSLEALLYGADTLPNEKTPPLKSHLFNESGIAFLRNDSVNVYLKYGPYGGGHDHLDRLNSIFFALDKVLMPDLGTSGYGIPLNQWYRSSAAHNLLAVDGKRQARCGGYLVSYKDGAVIAGVKDAYPGVDIRRNVILQDNGFDDRVWAESDESHQYDLFYHVRGKLAECNIPLQQAERFDKGSGYDTLREIRKGECSSGLNLRWTLRDTSGTLTLDCQSEQPFEVYAGLCPDNPADFDLSFLMLRIDGNRAEWKSNIRAGVSE